MGYVMLCLLGVVIEAVYMLFDKKKKYVIASGFKLVASLDFVLVAFLCSQRATNEVFAKSIIVCLILGALGDTLLGLRYSIRRIEQPLFIGGITSYLLGHCGYIYALSLIAIKNKYVYVGYMMGILAGVIASVCLLKHIDKIKLRYKIFVVIYSIAAFTLVAFALINLANNPRSNHSLLYSLGASFLALSDMLMVVNSFSARKKNSLRTTKISLYYLAQLLIAAGLLFV